MAGKKTTGSIHNAYRDHGTSTKDWFTSINISAIKTALDGVLPTKYKIKSLKIHIATSFTCKASARVYIQAGLSTSTSSIGQTILEEKQIGTMATSGSETYTRDITSYLASAYGSSIKTAYGSYFVFRMQSANIFKKTFTINSVTLEVEWYDYYTATFKNGETVLQADSVLEGLTPSYIGETPTKTKDYQSTYGFSGWSPAPSGITGNTIYTAQFAATPREYEIEVICEGNEYSGLKCSASGSGTYHYGDTVTLYAYDIPPNHEFFDWLQFNVQWEDNPKTFTLDEATIDLLFPYGTTSYYDDYLPLYGRITHTGFIVKANILPNNAGVVKIGFYYDLDFDGIDETYGDFRDITSQSYTVKYSEKDDWYINAIPNHGYKFVKWEDGSTENPRKVYINADAIYTAYFEEEFFTVNCSAIPAEGGTITGGGVYKRGDEIEIEIKANNGYTLIGYYENSVWNEESTNSLTYYLYAKEDVDIIAHFELDKINHILADTTQSTMVLIDLQETPGILIDTTKIYG